MIFRTASSEASLHYLNNWLKYYLLNILANSKYFYVSLQYSLFSYFSSISFFMAVSGWSSVKTNWKLCFSLWQDSNLTGFLFFFSIWLALVYLGCFLSLTFLIFYWNLQILTLFNFLWVFSILCHSWWFKRVFSSFRLTSFLLSNFFKELFP